MPVVLWALFTGGITGAVWVGIVLFQRQRRLSVKTAELLEDRQRTLDELDVLTTRMAEMEERLDFAERNLRLNPPPSDTPDA